MKKVHSPVFIGLHYLKNKGFWAFFKRLAKSVVYYDQLPKGQLGYLISTSAIAGIAIYLFSYPLKNTANRLVQLFHKYFFYLLIPPTALLIFATLKRVLQYGLTEERYGLCVISVWLLGIVIYYLVKGNKVKFSHFTLALGIMCVLSSLGPWNAVNLSVFSQEKRLESLLISHNILNNGRITKHKFAHAVPVADQKSISSIVRYLVVRKKLEKVAGWLTNTELQEYARNLMIGKHDHHPDVIIPQIIKSFGL